MYTILLAAAILQPPATAEAKRAGVPADAVALALADVAAAGEVAAFYRYVWVPTNDEDDADAVDLAVATAISKSTVLHRGVRLGERRLLRYDARLLAPKDEDLKILLETWERFEGDEPYFLVNNGSPSDALFEDVLVITAETAKAMTPEGAAGVVKRGDALPYHGEMKDNNGTWHEVLYQGKPAYIEAQNGKVESRKLEKTTPKRVFGPHLGDEAAGLALACNSQVPIVRHDYFIRKVLSTLDGGLYYEFRGIVPSPDAGVSDLDHFLRTFAGVEIAVVESLRADQKAAVFRSGVTAKPRATMFFGGTQSRVTVNQGLVVITQDIADADFDAAQDPLQNIIRHKFAGIELFLEMPNGMLAYALYTGDANGDGKYTAPDEGKLVRSVPDNIATDHLVPTPHTGRLQPAISCMRCHNAQRGNHKPEGWIEHPNDVTTLLQSGLDVFGERTDGTPKQDTVDRGAGLYTGDLEKPLGRARDDYAEAVLRLTGNPGTGDDSGVTLVVGRAAKVYADYWYDMVTPVTAARELGFTSTPETAPGLLRQILPPLPQDEIGVAPEDLRLGALKAGLSINRFQWEAVYADAAYRTLHTLLEEK